MINLNDIDRIVIDPRCQESWPCGHKSTVTLKDGRTVTHLSSFEICSIVCSISKDKINPGTNWKADSVIKHFEEYSTSSLGWEAESAEIVINRIFSKK
ncbi:MAG: hypothetical protein BGO10_06595 [Chlamydia sp. 32-24]|nr:MAG: hypothetical protein BGO10_06595 [Chlamydia sp. 32-24]